MVEWKHLGIYGTGEGEASVAGSTVALVVSVVSCLLNIIIIIIIIRNRRRASREFPRGPPAWPIIGHLPLLRTAPHRVLADLCLRQGYGPLIGLRLGSQPAVIVSSVALAKELLHTHDKTFANRPPYQFTDLLGYGFGTSVIFSSYNPHWSGLRKIYTLELFTAKRLQQLQHIRQDEVRGLLHRLLEASLHGTRAVDVGRLLSEMTSNTTARLLQSKTLAEAAPEFPELIRCLESEAIPIIGDFIPWLKFLDGPKKRGMKHLHDRIDKIIDSILVERRQLMARSPPNEIPQDFLQVLLCRATGNEGELLTVKEIKGIMLDIFVAGIHTSAVALEWAVVELIRNPACLRKLYDEIDGVLVGKGKEYLVKDEDIPKLPYLESTVKEIFRLHPVLPLLVPRISSEACKVGGGKYTVPKETQAFVNVWAICRDPEVWENPEAFWPERFQGKDLDVRGMHYELLPFGAGRRVCPGMRLGLSVVQVTLANLVKAFHWELPLGLTPSTIDMSEKRGLTSSKATPLLAIPKPRIL